MSMAGVGGDCDHLNSLFSESKTWRHVASGPQTRSSPGRPEAEGLVNIFYCYNCGKKIEPGLGEYDAIKLQHASQPPELEEENKQKYQELKKKEADQKAVEEAAAEAARTPQEQIAELERLIRRDLPPPEGTNESYATMPHYKERFDSKIQENRAKIAEIKAAHKLDGGGIKRRRRKSKNKKKRIIRKKIKFKKMTRKSKKMKRKSKKKTRKQCKKK